MEIQRATNSATTLVQDLAPLMTPDEVAGFFQVSSRTVRRWLKGGRLAAYKTAPSGSGRVRIPRTEVARLVDEMFLNARRH